jgi:hypothetical protein
MEGNTLSNYFYARVSLTYAILLLSCVFARPDSAPLRA